MDIKIQKAKKEDIPFLAQMILQSTRAEKKIGIFDYLFGSQNLLPSIEKLIVSPLKLYCYYENFLVATIDSKQVGCLCMYEPRKAKKEDLLAALENIDSSAKERYEDISVCEFFQERSIVMFDFLEEVEGYLDIGVIKELMRTALLNARLKGYVKAQTIVEIGSLESKLFYEALGFKILEEKECKEYQEIFGRKGVMLMQLIF